MADGGDSLESRLAGEWERVQHLQAELRAAAQRAAERERQLDALARKLERKAERHDRPFLRPRREHAPAQEVQAEQPPDPGLDELRRELESVRADLAERQAGQAHLEERASALDARAAELATREDELERLRFALAAQREQLASIAQRLRESEREAAGRMLSASHEVGFAEGLRAMARRAGAHEPRASD